MQAVEMLSEGEATTPLPAWAAVAEAIERVAAGKSLTLLLEGAQDASLSISYAQGYGVQVMAMQDGELGEKVLMNPAVRPKLVAVTLAGLTQEEPESTLVSRTLAIDAARHFLETGQRSGRLAWRDPLELEAEASRAR